MAAPSDPLLPVYSVADFSIGDTIEQCTLYTVPAGHIFVLEMVMARVFVRAGNRPPFRLALTDPEGQIASSNRGVGFKLEESASTAEGRLYTLNHLVRLYYREQITIQAYLVLGQVDSFVNEIAISGFLVMAPAMTSPP